MRKQLLRIEPDVSFSLLGIHCHFKDFRFVWTMNQVLKTEFHKMNPYIVEKTKAEFSRYQFQKDTECSFIFSNKSPYGFLIPKKKNVEYWVFLNENIDTQTTAHYKQIITNCKYILAVFEEKDTKTKEQLLF